MHRVSTRHLPWTERMCGVTQAPGNCERSRNDLVCGPPSWTDDPHRLSRCAKRDPLSCSQILVNSPENPRAKFVARHPNNLKDKVYLKA